MELSRNYHSWQNKTGCQGFLATNEPINDRFFARASSKIVRTVEGFKMPPGKSQKKVRPSTASGALESHEFVDLLDELRPSTAPGKNLLGLDPTYVTSRHHVPGVPITSKFKGRQVFGGIPENDFKGLQGRRATLGGLEDVEEHEKPKRPTTAIGVSKQIKVNYLNL